MPGTAPPPLLRPLPARAAAAAAFACLAAVMVFADASLRYSTGPVPPTDAPAAAPGRAVVVILDGLRAGAAEDPALMPKFNRMAAEGASGRLAAAGVPTTGAALKAVFEGTDSELPDFWTNFNPRLSASDNLPRSILARGGRVALFGSVVGRLAPRWPGAEGYGGAMHGMASIARNDARVAAQAAAQLRTRPADLTVVHFHEADQIGHGYLPTSTRYADAVRRYDARLDEVARAIDRTKTTLVVLSDHGMGDDGFHVGGSPDETLVPLLVWGKSAPAGARVEGRLVDLAPTLAQILAVPIPRRSTGTPLSGALSLAEAQSRDFLRRAQEQAESLDESWRRRWGGTGGRAGAFRAYSDSRRPLGGAFMATVGVALVAMTVLGGWASVASTAAVLAAATAPAAMPFLLAASAAASAAPARAAAFAFAAWACGVLMSPLAALHMPHFASSSAALVLWGWFLVRAGSDRLGAMSALPIAAFVWRSTGLPLDGGAFLVLTLVWAAWTRRAGPFERVAALSVAHAVFTGFRTDALLTACGVHLLSPSRGCDPRRIAFVLLAGRLGLFLAGGHDFHFRDVSLQNPVVTGMDGELSLAAAFSIALGQILAFDALAAASAAESSATAEDRYRVHATVLTAYAAGAALLLGRALWLRSDFATDWTTLHGFASVGVLAGFWTVSWAATAADAMMTFRRFGQSRP